MKEILVLCDTRQKNDKYITNYFDKKLIPWIRTYLPSADYMVVRYDNGFVKDYSVLIDTKKDLEEMVHNLCNAGEHERIKREIQKAKDLGCKKFVFLICENKILKVSDLLNWSSKRTKVKGVTLCKIMQTMAQRYGVSFIFSTKSELPSKIVDLLKS